MRFSHSIILLALAMVALPMLVAGADEQDVPAAKSRSLLGADTVDKADHGGWGGYGGGGGHYHMVPHGDHYHAVYHQPSYGGWGGHNHGWGGHNHGWGRKLMGADNVERATEVQKVDAAQNINEVQKVDEAQTAESANHGGWGGGGGGWGGMGGGHYDLVPHGDHYHSVYQPGPVIYNGWGHNDGHFHGRKLMALTRTKKPAKSAAAKSTKAPVPTQAPVAPKP